MRGVWVFKNLQLRVLTHSRKLFYSNSIILTSSTFICLFNWVDFILCLECYPFRILFLVDGAAGRKCGYKVTTARRVYTLIKVAQQPWITSHTHTHTLQNSVGSGFDNKFLSIYTWTAGTRLHSQIYPSLSLSFEVMVVYTTWSQDPN